MTFMNDWADDCLKWRGKILTGHYKHWCHEWDGLPVDETTPEWPCGCDFTGWPDLTEPPP